MSDGSIKIDIEVDGKQVNVASKELDNLGDAGRRSGKNVQQTEKGVKDVGKESSVASGKVKKFATALGLVAVGAAAFRTLKASMDDAITRFDTLEKFPKVLQALGVSAEESEKATQKLSDGIDGLPTKLDDISSTAQRMYTSFNDMDKATDTALALNNALLGSGSSAENARRGTEQYLQSLQKGKFEMEEWKTLQETMDVGLTKVAESFGFAGRSAKQDLYNALQDGTITMDEFNDKLIELGTGTGDLAKLAKENSMGIATSLGNLRIAAARGIANIIGSLDKLSREVTGNSIAENIDGLKDIVVSSFNTIGNVIEASAPVVKIFAAAIGTTMDVLSPLTPVVVGLTTALTGLLIVKGVGKAMTSFKTAVMAVTVVQKAATVATTASAVAYNTLTGRVIAARAAQISLTAATAGLRTAALALTGPVGWVTLGVGALAGATVAVVKWFNRSSEEAEQLKNETEELSKATDELNDSIEDSTDAYQDNQKDIESTARANEDLADRVEDLASKENKSAAEKKMLTQYIEQLNGSVKDLNLAYDEEADALNMSSKELRARVDLQNEEAKGMAAQERLREIEKERNEIGLQLEEINKLREEANELMKNGGNDAKDAKKSIEELDEQEQALKDTLGELNNQYSETEEQVKTSTENMATAIEEGNLRQIESYDDLEEEQKETFDNMMSKYEELRDAATDAFDRISDESKVSADEMIENLEHNQKMTEEWAENQAYLMEWGAERGYEGFMRHIDQLGIDQAAELDVIANMTDEQLEEYASLMEKGSETSLNAFNTKAGEGFDNFIDLLSDTVNDGAKNTRQELKDAGFEDMGKEIPEDLEGGVDSSSGELMTRLKNLSEEILGKFDGVDSEFGGVGSNIISGIKFGLNMNEGSVLTTARRIANSIKTTMQSALKIKSPSRVMKYDVGRWVPEGVAEGIRENAKSVYKEIDNLSDNMVKVSRPEVALETHRMAYSSGGFQTPQISSSPTSKPYNVLNQRQEKPANINIVVPGRTFRAFVQDIFDERDIQTRLEEGF